MSRRLDYPQIAPELTKKLFELSQASSQSTVDRTLRDLILLRVSQLNHCAFCVDMHVKEAKIHDERELRLHHVAVWRESPLFSEKEKAGLEWAETVTLVSETNVPDDVYERVKKQFSPKELVDLTFAIGVINFWNRLGVSFRAEPGSMDKALGLDRAEMR
jgi:AhpD family alkylhydroperoxidase